MRPTFANAKLPGKIKPHKPEKYTIWIKYDIEGKEYLSIKSSNPDGTFENHKAYRVNNKKSDVAPDYIAYVKD
jgi:hypothetical protein